MQDTLDKDALVLLEADHAGIRSLLARLASAVEAPDGNAAAVMLELSSAMRVHARIEEVLFYPAFLAAAEVADDVRLFHRAVAEHALAEQALTAVENQEALAPEQVRALVTIVEEHVKAEEATLFARMRAVVDASKLLELGGRIEQFRTELTRTAAGSNSSTWQG